MMRRLSIAVLLCAAPVSVLAETPSAPAQPSASGRDDPDRVICRRESVTGSLTQTRKVCMTRADWAARTRNAQNETQQMQEKGLINSCGATVPGAC